MIPTSELPVKPRRTLLPFGLNATEQQIVRMRVGRAFVKRLYAVIVDSIQDTRIPLPVIERIGVMVDELSFWANLEDSQIDQIVLWAMEEHNLVNETEIAEELAISREWVVDILERLETSGQAYKVSRLVPGSGRPQHMWKSNGVDNVEVYDQISTAGPGYFSQASWTAAGFES